MQELEFDTPEAFDVPEPETELPIDREGFEFFHANFLPHWLRLLPGEFNILSSYTYLQERVYDAERARKGSGKAGKSDVDSLTYSRKMFLDSGLVSILKQGLVGKATLDDVDKHLSKQSGLMEMAWECYSKGVKSGVVCHMDFLAADVFLKALNVPREYAYEWTFTNALDWRDLEAPPGWKKVYALQGSTSLDSYLSNLDLYQGAGILDQVRDGEAWLAVGSILGTRPPALYTIVGGVRRALGPEGHIHALGIGSTEALKVMVGRGWIQSSDSATPTLQVARNLGPYHVDGPRRHYMYLAQMAANAELFECELYDELHKAARKRKDEGASMDEMQVSLL